MNVRKATKADLPHIVEMSAQFYETTSYRRFAEFCRESVEGLTMMLIDTGVMLVAEDSRGDIVGMAGLVVAPFMFNNAHKAAYEVVWWVNPDARSEGAGIALLRAIEPACKDAGCVAVQMVHLHNSPPQAAVLYGRLGYSHSESSYTKVI